MPRDHPVKVPKLVRDKMPEIMTRYRDTFAYERIEGEEFLQALLDKLVEEADEVRDDPNLEELADLWEVYNAVLRETGVTHHDVCVVAKTKRLSRGGFTEGIYLTKFEWGPGLAETAT